MYASIRWIVVGCLYTTNISFLLLLVHCPDFFRISCSFLAYFLVLVCACEWVSIIWRCFTLSHIYYWCLIGTTTHIILYPLSLSFSLPAIWHKMCTHPMLKYDMSQSWFVKMVFYRWFGLWYQEVGRKYMIQKGFHKIPIKRLVEVYI